MQIHTSRHAGGIASWEIRSSVSGSSIRSPAGSLYSKPRPRRRRAIPGAAQSDRRSLGTVLSIAAPSGMHSSANRNGPFDGGEAGYTQMES